MSGGSGRFEYIKQPHIIVIIIVIMIAVCAAFVTGFLRIRDIQRRQSMETTQACQELVKDEALCRFAAASITGGKRSQIITSTTTNGETTEVSTLEVENPARMKSVTLDGLQEVEAYVVIDAVTYVKDYSDNTWAMFDDPEYDPASAESTDTSYDFTSAQSPDVIEFRDHYKSEGMEPCGDFTCYKYGIIDPDSGHTTSYIWFDDKDFLLRRHMLTQDGVTTNMQFSYQPVTIQAPSPTKPVTAEELEAYL